MTWAIIAHGGAKKVRRHEEPRQREGVRSATIAGIDILRLGGTAVDAVETVVRKLEDNPCFNAGVGSVRNEKGEIELDASIMDGQTLDIGAVAGLLYVRNPVSVARALLREKPILLVGQGVNDYAAAKGFPLVEEGAASGASTGCDTVGCVARDMHGNLAVATSTGGLEGAKAGRVGDVPLPGCGFYADNARGAASLSGQGEAIARVMLAAEALKRMEDMPAPQAVRKALALIARVEGEAGIIAIAPDGKIGWTHNSPHFVVALATAENSVPQTFLSEEEAHDG